MSSSDTVISAEALELYRSMHDAGLNLPNLKNLEEFRYDVRAAFDPWVQDAIAKFDGEIEDIEIPGVGCKQVTPKGWSPNEGVCIQYAYGGGFISGICYEDLIIAAPLAQLAGCRVVMVDYRLSPEHPYPVPQEDMRRVYMELLRKYGAQRLVVCGESAGGNQALGLMQYVRDKGLPLPLCAALLSPWCDLSNRDDSDKLNDGRDPTLSTAWVKIAATAHADGQALDDPGISPLYGDMEGLPDCMITTGSRDLLLMQCVRLARKLDAAGVACDLRVNEGMWHVFEFYPIPEAERSLREVAAFITNHC